MAHRPRPKPGACAAAKRAHDFDASERLFAIRVTKPKFRVWKIDLIRKAASECPPDMINLSFPDCRRKQNPRLREGQSGVRVSGRRGY
jgi:hypothetical protein